MLNIKKERKWCKQEQAGSFCDPTKKVAFESLRSRLIKKYLLHLFLEGLRSSILPISSGMSLHASADEDEVSKAFQM